MERVEADGVADKMIALRWHGVIGAQYYYCFRRTSFGESGAITMIYSVSGLPGWALVKSSMVKSVPSFRFTWKLLPGVG